jgi:chorismate mutase/prephenate dehydratase
MNKDIAAIGSERAARIYDLCILKEAIQDNVLNTTRFIVLKKETGSNPKADKISLVFATPHTAGSLYQVLEVFAQHKINMLKIESRPIKNHPGEYSFYVDINGNLQDKHIEMALKNISVKQKFFKLLGNYPSSK